MFDELNNYKINDHFFFQPGNELEAVCNAPGVETGDLISGVFLVYALARGRIMPVYIGHSGVKGNDGIIMHQQGIFGGLKETIINGDGINILPPRILWPAIMKHENIEALDIYWYVTYHRKKWDSPEAVAQIMLERFIDIYGSQPKWNKA